MFIKININAYFVHYNRHYRNIKGDYMNDEIIIVSVPYGTEKEELKNIREKYSGKELLYLYLEKKIQETIYINY